MSFSAISRRRFIGGLGLVAAGLLVPARFADPTVRRGSRMLMGTRIGIVAEGMHPGETDHALTAAFEGMARLEKLMSRYRGDSTVAALQRAAGRHAVAVAPEVMAVLLRARSVSELSGGAFDITVGAYDGWRFEGGGSAAPAAEALRRQRALVDYRDVVLDERRGTAYLGRPGMRLDLGGIAKLPILQAGLQILRHHGIVNAMIDGGGDVLTLGRLQERPWRVGIRDPLHPELLLGVLEMNDGVVASSGDYERFFERDGRRYHHILDPRTGYPSSGLRGVTLVSRGSADLNGLGAAMMVMGADAMPALTAGAGAPEALAVDAAGHLRLTAGFDLRTTLRFSKA